MWWGCADMLMPGTWQTSPKHRQFWLWGLWVNLTWWARVAASLLNEISTIHSCSQCRDNGGQCWLICLAEKTACCMQA